MKTFLISFILHSMVIIIAMLSISFQSPTFAIEVPIFIASDASLAPSSLVHESNKMVKTHPSSATKRNSLPTLGKKKVKKMDEQLLITIHAALARQQIYPDGAQWLQEKGSVQIGFFIFPDGTLNEIKILHSSGFADLDQAALLTANKASPILSLKNKFQHKRYFTIDIIFE